MKFSRINVLATAVLASALAGCVTTGGTVGGNGNVDSNRYVVNGSRVIGSSQGVPVIQDLNLGPLERSGRRIAGHIVDLQYGKVVVSGNVSLVGVGAGGVVGGALGNRVGKGNGRKAMTVLGALVGAGVGAGVSSAMNEKTINAYKMVIDLENGTRIQVLQADRGEDFYKGYRVYSSQNSKGVWEVAY